MSHEEPRTTEEVRFFFLKDRFIVVNVGRDHPRPYFIVNGGVVFHVGSLRSRPMKEKLSAWQKYTPSVTEVQDAV